MGKDIAFKVDLFNPKMLFLYTTSHFISKTMFR